MALAVAITCNCRGKEKFISICHWICLHIFSLSFLFYSSGSNAFASLLSSKSPLHHSSVNAVPKNLLSNPLQLNVSGKNNMQTPNSNVSGQTSTSSHKEQLMNFHDQMKNKRPPTKPGDTFSNSTTNATMNTNQMRSMQSSTVSGNQASAAPPRRPIGGNSPQQLDSTSDDDIMVNDV